MKHTTHVVAAAAARLYTPMLLLFAFSLLATRPPGSGIGFMAGLAFGLALVLHALVFGASAARAAFPPFAARLILAAGVAAGLAGAGAPRLSLGPQLTEAGLFFVTTAAAALVLSVMFGRLPTLRDAEW